MANTKIKDQDWVLIIKPETVWWDLWLREVWRYRDLVVLFVRRDFVAIYKQTLIGPLWYILQLLMTSTIFTVVFGKIANLSANGRLERYSNPDDYKNQGYACECII